MTSITINQEHFKDVSNITSDILPCFTVQADDGSIYSLLIKVDENNNTGVIGVCSGQYNGLNRIFALSSVGSWYAEKIITDLKNGTMELTYQWGEPLDYFATAYDVQLSVSQIGYHSYSAVQQETSSAAFY